ncbi:hypothetical protein ACWDCL_01915 [Streptomyces sp. NPDC001009]
MPVKGGFYHLTLPPTVQLVGTVEDWDCALIVQPNAAGSEIREAREAVRRLGLEVIPEEEHAAELLDDGNVRLWLVPTNPADPFEESAAEDLEIAA